VPARRALALALCLAALVLAVPRVAARAADLDTVRVGKAQAISLAFLPLEIGEMAGIWPQVGIKLDIAALRGDPQVQQALTSDSIDVGLGSGPGLGFLAKGVPALGIAVLANAPFNMALVVAENSPVKKPGDLKGRRIGVSGGGSLTEWLAKQIALQQGWPASAITTVPLGDPKAYVAALKTGNVDAFVAGTEVGYDLQERGQGKVLLDFGTVVKDFHTHIIYARTDFVSSRPELVKRFLTGWFRSVAYMRTHRDETIALGAKVEGMSPEAMGLTYDATMPMMSRDGSFSQRALDHLAQSFVDLGILDQAPNPNQFITTKFIPVRI
jgi:NitT/TauT family transport system substrate-binding protein